MLGKEPDGLENAFSWYLKGDALVPGEFQPLSWYWYTSALLARAFRPNAALAKAINQALTSSGMGAALAGNVPVLGMQVRRGDGCSASWRNCYPVAQYMAYADQMRAAYGASTIYIATDSSSVLQELTTTYTNYTFLHFEGGKEFSRLVEHVFPASEGQKNVWDNVVPRNRDEGRTYVNTLNAWLTHIDVVLLSKCDAFVGTMSTNVLRLAYEMHTGDTNVLAPFASLDTPWCFDWPLQWQQNPVSRDGTLIC